MGHHTAAAPVAERPVGGAVCPLLRDAWQSAGGVECRSHYTRAAVVCSRRGDGQTGRWAARAGAVEGLVERCWSAEGVRWGWSRARWEVGGDIGSCFCLCCYWASRAVHGSRAWRASVVLGARRPAATVAVAAVARVSHCDIETFSGAPSAALLCRLPCCATITHLRS